MSAYSLIYGVMSRPLSPLKRQAILEAAAKCIAEAGLSVSTARVARQAGVAEGTLFTYFATKESLLRALLLDIEQNLAASLPLDGLADSDARGRVRAIWDAVIDWNLASRHRSKGRESAP